MQHLDHLSDTQQSLVLDLINRTTHDDGTPPIAEHILLHLRYGGDKADSHLLVEKDNQVIGYAHLDQTDLVAGPCVELVVDPSYRGEGVGKALLSEAIKICGKSLRLWVHGEHSHDHDGEASHAHPAIGEIYITAVDPVYSGLGIGKALTITALNYLKYQGLKDAILYVDAENKSALKLYSSIGFMSSSMDVIYKLPII